MKKFEDLTNREKAILEVAIKWFGYTDEEVLKNIDSLKDDYLVLTEGEANSEAIESIKNLIDDYGVGCINNININKYVDEYYFKNIFKEHYYFYVEDIANEPANNYDFNNRLDEEMSEKGCTDVDEFVQALLDDINDFIEEYKFQYGDEAFNEIVTNNNLIDIDALAEEILEIDGRGHIISRYEGTEYKSTVENETYFVYRIN